MLRTYRRTYEADQAESVLRALDDAVYAGTRISVFHLLTFASIAGAIALFLRGKKLEGIFVGLWPPTFQALKSAIDHSRSRY